jgi:hypothetical protein
MQLADYAVSNLPWILSVVEIIKLAKYMAEFTIANRTIVGANTQSVARHPDVSKAIVEASQNGALCESQRIIIRLNRPKTKGRDTGLNSVGVINTFI